MEEEIMENEKKYLIQFMMGSGLVSISSAQEIAAQFAEKTVGKNEYFFKEGRIANEYLFLEEGFMRSFAYDLNGDEVTTGFYSQHQVVFEVSSFFTRTISRENIQALTDCRGWFISYEQLNMLFHTIHDFREFGRSVLVKGLVSLKARMLSMITETAEERYGRLLTSNPEIFQYAPLKTIASYLGITDSSLSRIRKEFSKK
jgi:CRP-like cAMP-binding protein